MPTPFGEYLTLWLSWLLATTAGGAAIGTIIVLTGSNEIFVFLFFTGFVIGVAQWLILRRYFRGALWWVPASGFAWFVSLIVMSSIVGETNNPIAEFISSVFGLWRAFELNVAIGTGVGAGLGVAQWLVLRRQTLFAGWWVLASVVGGAINGAVAVSVGSINGFGGMPLPYVAGWAANGAVTGIVLAWMLSNRTEIGRDR
jgi:hypothetical protein